MDATIKAYTIKNAPPDLSAMGACHFFNLEYLLADHGAERF
jgi:hypothetical protein